MNWRTIETAPKDGTEILGWREDAGVMLIRYTCLEDFLVESQWAEYDADTLEEQDWFFADFISGGRLDGGMETPTHWMPLPAPPVKA